MNDHHQLCPECGDRLVLRTARRGANAGNQFYGCNDYPRCRYTAAIQPSETDGESLQHFDSAEGALLTVDETRELPPVIDASQTAFFVPTEEQACSTVRAVVIN
jgi:ssDNA-binding Zn-finger/Zn-ribbon topoisomerase 1